VEEEGQGPELDLQEAWLDNITRAPPWPSYVGLSLVEAENGSLFDT
jgi:hypothetical protein